jgi:D-glycero-alpha-D-manno-heptose-7-phosphate kinase
MIIARSPLRISLGGGGTDLPSYYKKNDGMVLSAAIDKYVYVTLTKPFIEGIYLKYSKIEKVKSINQIQHNLIKNTFKELKYKNISVELTTLADIPAGTGLGSSSSFTTALLKALYHKDRKLITQNELAEKACEIEINKCKSPIGKQDQYISAFGGITKFNFGKNGKVRVNPLNISQKVLYDLEDNLLMFFTGYIRSANKILLTQNQKSLKSNTKMLKALDNTKKFGYEILKLIEKGELESFGELMNIHWQEKKKRSIIMSNPKIDSWYNDALKNGAIGGKIVGAGGGGFLLFYTSNKEKLRAYFKKQNLREVRFKFDFEGSKLII